MIFGLKYDNVIIPITISIVLTAHNNKAKLISKHLARKFTFNV